MQIESMHIWALHVTASTQTLKLICHAEDVIYVEEATTVLHKLV
jgi:hypothetical protein